MPISEEAIAYFAQTNFRDDSRVFGIRQKDRRYHIYILGKTGTGKSTLIETLCSEDIRVGRGFMLIDPHGDLYEAVRERVPEYAEEHLIDLDLPRTYQYLSFNPLRGVPEDKRLLTASSMLLSAFKKLWGSYWGPRMEHILRNTLLSLIGSTPVWWTLLKRPILVMEVIHAKQKHQSSDMGRAFSGRYSRA